jgi:hypothetical protein
MVKEVSKDNETVTSSKESNHKMKTTKGDIEGFDRAIWNYMKKQLKLKEDQILKMRMARCPAKSKGRPTTVVRFFDPEKAQGKGLTINDYASLDEYPELILYDGYHVQGKDGEIIIEKRNSPEMSLLERKMVNGEIEEVGVITEKTGAQKFLSGFGHFLMYGGFLIIIVVIVAIVILISILTK